MDQDTDIGGINHKFPVTRYSAVVGVRSEDREIRERAWETILASYWKPAYKYIRIKWQASNEDAKDLTQGFFASALEKGYFSTYDVEKASFQTFFRTCLDRFVANSRKAEQRLKRGGNSNHFSLDFNSAENELALHSVASDLNPEDYFHREWVRSLLAIALETLRAKFEQDGRAINFKLFELYDLREEESATRVSYASLAKDFDLSVTDVTNHLAAARREFRKIVLEKLREITATEDEFRNEARALLGIDVK
jgi:DNA-directed RNA polymerase specialized sigma24 family protein